MAALFFQFHQVFSNVFHYYYAKKNFKTPSLYNLLSRIISAGSVILALYLTRSLFWAIFAYIVSTSFVNILAYYNLKRSEIFNQKSEINVVPEGRKLTLIGIIPTISNNFEQIAVSYFLGFIQLANYIITIKLTDTVKGFFNLWGNILFPKFVNTTRTVFLEKLRNVWIWLSWILLVLLLIIILPIFIPLLFGDEYKEIVVLAQLYSLVLIPRMIQRFIQNWSVARGELKLYFNITNILRIIDVGVTIVILIFYRTIFALILIRVINSYILALLSFLLMKYSNLKYEPAGGFNNLDG